MSIYKRCSATNRDIKQIEERVKYIFNDGKTKPEFCHTLGVAKGSVFDDMVFLKQLYCRTGSINASERGLSSNYGNTYKHIEPSQSLPNQPN